MAHKTKKNEGPSCACGRPEDLYELWLENEKNKKDVSDESTSNEAKDSVSKTVTMGKKE